MSSGPAGLRVRSWFETFFLWNFFSCLYYFLSCVCFLIILQPFLTSYTGSLRLPALTYTLAIHHTSPCVHKLHLITSLGSIYSQSKVIVRLLWSLVYLRMCCLSPSLVGSVRCGSSCFNIWLHHVSFWPQNKQLLTSMVLQIYVQAPFITQGMFFLGECPLCNWRYGSN